ncbi:MAG: YihY/virulence factor BrkB family protein [Thermoleophilaceae bacterium]
MHARHAWQVTRHAVADFFEDRALQLAAAISYYALLAVFPVAILAVTAFGVVIGEEEARRDVIDFLTRQLPVTDTGRQDIEQVMRDVTANRGAFGLVGAVGLLISASGLMAAIRNALNTAWDLEDRRPPLRGKAVDLLLVLGIGLVIGASFAISITRAVVHDLATAVAGFLGGPLESAIPAIVNVATWLLPLVLSLAIFTVLYRFVPVTEVRWRDALTGGAIAMAGYELAKIGFGVYVDNFADYGAVYGTLGAVVAFVFFIFLVANIFLLGAEVASERPRVAAGAYDDEPEDERSRGEQVRDALRGLVVDESDR